MVEAVVGPADSETRNARASRLAWRPNLICYGIAIASVALAFAARVLLSPALHEEAPYLFFVPAVLLAAGLGGLGPGLFATGLSLLLGFFVIAAFPDLSIGEAVNVVAFAVIGVGISWGTAAAAQP